MSRVSLRWVTHSGFTSNVIRHFEYGFWATHVEALLGDGTVIGAYIDLGQVARRPADYDAADWAQQLIVEMPFTADQEQLAVQFLNAQLGKPYDDFGLGSFVVARDWRSPDHWWCSDLQTAMCERSGWMERLATDITTPRDLLLVVSGKIPVGIPQSRPR